MLILTGKVRVPLTTLDVLNAQYGAVGILGRSRIAFVIIDVEGREEDVLMGARGLIEQQSFVILGVEVWTKHSTIGIDSMPPLRIRA